MELNMNIVEPIDNKDKTRVEPLWIQPVFKVKKERGDLEEIALG